MTNSTVIRGTIDHGTVYTYANNARHQPYDTVFAPIYNAANPGYLLQTIPLPSAILRDPSSGYNYVPKTITMFEIGRAHV